MKLLIYTTMLIGHANIIRDLKRLADEGELSHGYVFCGPAMIGKRLVAEALANYLETGNFEEPKVLQDYLVIRSDASGTVGIDQARQVKLFLWRKPAVSAKCTVVIDDAHAMTAEAQNALLEITEEPPASSLIILVTSDPDALNPTVFSRLQKIFFSPAPQAEFLSWVTVEFSDKKNVKDAVLKSVGRPGLLRALLGDEDFAELIKDAANLASFPSEKRKDFLKKLMDREDFNFLKLLDALILLSSWEFSEKKEPEFWHELVRLRHEAGYFNLNPKLQFESLFSSVHHSVIPMKTGIR